MNTVKQAIEKARALQPELNAAVTFIDTDKEGIPVILKDNICTSGVRTTASSRILDNYIPVYNATIVDKLEAAGYVAIVKASMDELGMGGTNRNAATGPVHNFHDHARISGGSSGGCAVLTAAQAAPLAVGTDTGDSVRKPASYNGVIGVKPTYGRISRYGIIPYASSLDTVGYFTTNVKDAARALSVLAGRDDHDMTSSFAPVPDYEADLKADLAGRKIGIFTTVNDAVKNEEVKALFERLEEKLKAAGAELVPVTMPETLMNLIAPVYKTIANSEATANHSNLDGIRFGVRKPGESVEDVMTASRTAGFSSYVRERFVIGSYALFEENQDRLFRKAQKIRRLIVEAYARMFEGVDGVLCVAAPDIAPLLETSSDVRFGMDDFVEEHMQLANFSGYPSMVIPMGKAQGMPVACELACRPFEEQTMFDLAAGIEEVLHD